MTEIFLPHATNERILLKRLASFHRFFLPVAIIVAYVPKIDETFT